MNKASAGETFTLTGKTVGRAYDLGFESKLRTTFGLGLKLGAVLGSIGEFEKNNGVSAQTIKPSGGERESISRIDFSVVLKWHQPVN